MVSSFYKITANNTKHKNTQFPKHFYFLMKNKRVPTHTFVYFCFQYTKATEQKEFKPGEILGNFLDRKKS